MTAATAVGLLVGFVALVGGGEVLIRARAHLRPLFARRRPDVPADHVPVYGTLLVLGGYLVRSIGACRKESHADDAATGPGRRWWVDTALVVAGVAPLVVGARLLVDTAFRRSPRPRTQQWTRAPGPSSTAPTGLGVAPAVPPVPDRSASADRDPEEGLWTLCRLSRVQQGGGESSTGGGCPLPTVSVSALTPGLGRFFR